MYRLDTDQPGALLTMVAGLMPGTESSSPEDLVSTGDALYFFANTPAGQQFMHYDLDSGAGPMVANINWTEFGVDPANRIGNLAVATP